MTNRNIVSSVIMLPGLVPLVKSFRLNIFVVVLLVQTGCHKPAVSQINASKHRMLPVISFLDAHLAAKMPLPATQDDLDREYLTRTKYAISPGLHYVPMDDGGYKLVEYLRGRTALIFVSKDDGAQHRGWWLDDESGGLPIEVP